MDMNRRRLAGGLAAMVVLLHPLAPSLAQPQNYPAKPVRIIIPGAAGAPPDILARALSPSLSQALGQPFVVDNRIGANGIIGMEAVVKAVPDGYTLCITQGAPVSLNPYFYRKLSYEPLRDLAPVVNVGVIAASILVSSSVSVRSMRELIDQARARPQSLLWATWGPGSFSDLYRAWAESAFGVSVRDVPYKTPIQAFNAVVAGEAHVMLNASGSLPPFIESGKIRALATIGPARYPTLPDVPSFSELGYDLDFRGWVGVFAPAGTPGEVVSRLNAEINRIIGDPKFIERFLVPASIEHRGGTPEQFASFLKSDRETAGRLVKLTKVQPE
jgi:tripartite-type tricarboxylate transporter receptor subunit TctC